MNLNILVKESKYESKFSKEMPIKQINIIYKNQQEGDSDKIVMLLLFTSLKIKR